MVNRAAFTFIELIFAIVIISIAVMSLPMLTHITSKGIEDNVVQEAIFAASTELNQALSYKWDENSTENNNTISRVIWTSTTSCDNTTKLRLGHIQQPKHRRCLENNDSRPTHTDDGGNDDLDDAEDGSTSLYLGDGTTAKGYKADYNRTISVTQDAVFDQDDGADANIKQVSVTVYDTNGNIVTQLNSYSANIGEIDFHSRIY